MRWRRDGKELFYVALDSRLIALPIQLASNAQTIDAGTPIPLFATHVGGAVQVFHWHQYLVSPDDVGFLMSVGRDTADSPITVLLKTLITSGSRLGPGRVIVRHVRRGHDDPA